MVSFFKNVLELTSRKEVVLDLSIRDCSFYSFNISCYDQHVFHYSLRSTIIFMKILYHKSASSFGRHLLRRQDHFENLLITSDMLFLSSLPITTITAFHVFQLRAVSSQSVNWPTAYRTHSIFSLQLCLGLPGGLLLPFC